jgi:amino acid transporter
VSAPAALRQLARVLTLRDLVLIVVGTTIGSGIFTVPGAVLRQSGGDLGVALLVWLLGSVLALLGALTFGELGAMLPDAGGSYTYVREAFGPPSCSAGRCSWRSTPAGPRRSRWRSQTIWVSSSRSRRRRTSWPGSP